MATEQIINVAGFTGIGVLSFHVFNYFMTNKRALRIDLYKSIYQDSAESFIENLRELSTEMLSLWHLNKIDELKATFFRFAEVYAGCDVLLERQKSAFNLINAISLDAELKNIQSVVVEEMAINQTAIRRYEAKFTATSTSKTITQSDVQAVYQLVLGTERLLKEKLADARKLLIGHTSDLLIPGIAIGALFSFTSVYVFQALV